MLSRRSYPRVCGGALLLFEQSVSLLCSLLLGLHLTGRREMCSLTRTSFLMDSASLLRIKNHKSQSTRTFREPFWFRYFFHFVSERVLLNTYQPAKSCHLGSTQLNRVRGKDIFIFDLFSYWEECSLTALHNSFPQKATAMEVPGCSPCR